MLLTQYLVDIFCIFVP